MDDISAKFRTHQLFGLLNRSNLSPEMFGISRQCPFLYSICVCCFVSGYSTRSEPQHGYMTHFYFNRKFIQVNDSMVLELTSKLLSDDPGKDFLTCDVMVVTSPGRRLLLHFLSLEISDEDNSIDR